LARRIPRGMLRQPMRGEGMRTDRFAHERRLWAEGRAVAGLDEVGTGAWAGPVVAGCVMLSPEVARAARGAAIDDSKRLTARRRVELAGWLREVATAWGLGWVAPGELVQLGIARGALLAMERALAAAEGRPDHLLVDARSLPSFRGDQTPLVGGDRLSASIGAASILAKVSRDAFMDDLGRQAPGYGFERHKGYGTAEHRAAIERLGPCAAHRPAFLPTAARQLDLFRGGA